MAKKSQFINQLSRSLASLASEKDVLADVVSDCAAISEALVQNPDLRLALSRVSVPTEKRTEIFKSAVAPFVHEYVVNAYSFLLEKNELARSELFVDCLRRAATREGLTEIRITTARELSEAEKNKIVNAAGLDMKKATVSVKLSPSVLGGLIVDIGDIRHDASLIGKIKRFEQAIHA